MVFLQAFEDVFHHGVANEGRAGRNLESAAIFVYCSQLLLVEEHRLALRPFERGPLLVQITGIHSDEFLFACHTNANIMNYLYFS